MDNKTDVFLKEFYKDHPNIELLSMLLDEHAIDVNTYRDEYNNTLLEIAADDKRNYALTELLLRYGAEPNVSLDEEDNTVLWNMQYIWEDGNYDESILITELLLRYGADPAIICDNETLYEYVRYKVFNEYGESDYDYIILFFTLLVVYGAENLKDKLDYIKPFNKDIALAYRIYFKDAGDGYHEIGVIYGPDGKTYAEV